MMTTQEKRRAKLDRAALLSLRAALCPDSGREKLSLNCVQRQLRADLKRGTTVELAAGRGNKMRQLHDLEVVRHGRLNRAECRAVQPSTLEPRYGLLWADLTPPQRKALRKYRAGKKKERELSLALKQLKAEGCREEATRNLNQAIKHGDAQAASYWRGRLAKLSH